MNDIAFHEAERLIKELAAVRLRAREVTMVLRREEAAVEVIEAVERAQSELLAVCSDVSQVVYPAYVAARPDSAPANDEVVTDTVAANDTALF